MKIKIFIFLIIIISYLTACATPAIKNENYERVTSISLEQLNSKIDSMELVTIDELLGSSRELQQTEIDVEINSDSAKVINIKGSKYLARAFKVKKGTTKIVEIKSHIIPVKESADYLFFPVLTVYDASKERLAELQPNNEYSVYYGVLNVKFTIPTEASYVLINTKQEYLDIGSIDGTEGGLSPDVNYSSQDISLAVSTVIGGAIGGAIAGAIDSRYRGARPENYYFGPGGILDIKLLSQN